MGVMVGGETFCARHASFDVIFVLWVCVMTIFSSQQVRFSSQVQFARVSTWLQFARFEFCRLELRIKKIQIVSNPAVLVHHSARIFSYEYSTLVSLVSLHAGHTVLCHPPPVLCLPPRTRLSFTTVVGRTFCCPRGHGCLCWAKTRILREGMVTSTRKSKANFPNSSQKSTYQNTAMLKPSNTG